MSQQIEDKQRAGYCRQCGERLPLIKRVKREEFCSEEHRLQFLNSATDVALGRLRETGVESLFENGFGDEDPILDEIIAGGVVGSSHEELAALENGHGHAAANGTGPAAIASEAPEPADPPMAGSIAPHPVSSVLRLAFVSGSDDTALGQWDLMKPERELVGPAVHFGLAEFASLDLAALNKSVSLSGEQPAADISLDATASGNGVVLPRNAGNIDNIAEPGSCADSANAEQAPHLIPSIAQVLGDAALQGRPMPVHLQGPGSEAVELDAVLYLPEPTNAIKVAATPALRWASWLLFAGVPLCRAHGAEAVPVQPEQPVLIECAPAAITWPPLQLSVEADDASATYEMLLAAEAGVAQPATDFDEHLLALPEDPAPKAPLGEETGMDEAVQTMAAPAGVTPSGGRGRVPFLQEPQPRAGSAKPRWSPVTAGLNTAAETASEDWDIL